MYKVTSKWAHQDSIKIEWNLGKRCNYDCSYCPTEIHDKVSPHTDIKILKNSIDYLVSLNKPIRLSFTGGEPCVHPKFKELVEYARNAGVSWISVTTNGTRSFKFYSSLPVDQYVFSIHFEYKWKKIVDTICRLSKTTSIKLISQIICHHDYMSDVKSVYNIMVENQVPNTLRRIRWTNGDHDAFDDLRYNETDLAWIKSHEATVQPNTLIFFKDKPTEEYHANDIIKLNLNQYKGWSCNAGIESLMINWDGNVYRATCRVGGIIGNIYNGSFIIPTNQTICDRNFCTCAADIPLTKFLI